MRSGILKLLLSNYPKPAGVLGGSAAPPAATLRFLSSLPRRSPGGGRRRETRAEHDSDEEFFLRNLNFGDEKPKGRGSPATSARPPRGEPTRAFDPEGDLFSADIDKKPSARDPLGGIPDRLMRGQRRERPPRRESFDLGGFGATAGLGSAKRSDLGDREITFDKQEGDERPGPSLVHELKLENAASPDGSLREEHTLQESCVEDADAIFSRLKKTGLIPNAVAMLDGLCKDGLVQDAMKLFGLMREKGTIPEVVIYTAVVEGFCRANKYDDAKRVFRKMQKNGIVPNAFSYGIIIQGLCKGKRWEDCVEFCLEMLGSGHSPNVATFTGLVDGICKDKGVEEAEVVLRRLREGGLAIDEKAIRDHLDKRGPFSPLVWEAIFGKKEFKSIF